MKHLFKKCAFTWLMPDPLEGGEVGSSGGGGGGRTGEVFGFEGNPLDFGMSDLLSVS